MPRLVLIVLCGLLWPGASRAYAQISDVPIKTFGYFQNLFQHFESSEARETENTFSAQQLNLLLQTDFSRRWRAFVNFEVLNNFSSSRAWGSLDLDEAWVRYRANRQLIIRAGLQVPRFNRLNEIKNRTPLLPYIIRPLIYEESFAEFIQIDEFIPDRAFAQVEGSLPVGAVRLDYAAHIGNSPNINSAFDNERTGDFQQTGVDTTTTVLVGGRAGVRVADLEVGVSGTYDQVNFFRELSEPMLEGAAVLLPEVPPERFDGVPRTRLGVDVTAYRGPFFFEGEMIAVRYGVEVPPELARPPGDDPARLDLDRAFYYGTLGYAPTERLLLYGSYWFTDQALFIRAPEREIEDQVDIAVWTLGARQSLVRDDQGFDRVALKLQYAYVEIDVLATRTNQRFRLDVTNTTHVLAAAVSVLF